MRGADCQTAAMFSYISPETLVPQDHPLPAIRPLADAALERLISHYTREAGVRNLEREIGTVARKVARRIATGDVKRVKVTDKELDRYLGWPGQALAFKVGARLWNEARAAREAADGDAFSLRDFHRDALGLGPMGLEPLRARLLS